MSSRHIKETSKVLPVARRVGNAIRFRREQLGWSQEDLGFAANTHRTYVGAIERGNKAITIAKLVQVAEALGCLPSQILKDCGL